MFYLFQIFNFIIGKILLATNIVCFTQFLNIPSYSFVDSVIILSLIKENNGNFSISAYLYHILWSQVRVPLKNLLLLATVHCEVLPDRVVRRLHGRMFAPKRDFLLFSHLMTWLVLCHVRWNGKHFNFSRSFQPAPFVYKKNTIKPFDEHSTGYQI